MTLLTTLAMLTVRGIPLPPPVMDRNAVILVLLCCCFLTLAVFTRCRATLAEDIRTFLLQNGRTRNSLFNPSSTANRRLLSLIVPEACILTAVFIYFVLHAIHPDRTPHRPFLLWVGLCGACCLLYVLVKRLAYAVIGWTFIERSRVGTWMQAYAIILRLTSLVMLPATLVIALLDAGPAVTVCVGLSLLVLVKLLILFKWIKLFCNKPYGYIPICVYFCALEIIPIFYMAIGIMKLNEFVVFNF